MPAAGELQKKFAEARRPYTSQQLAALDTTGRHSILGAETRLYLALIADKDITETKPALAQVYKTTGIAGNQHRAEKMVEDFMAALRK